MHFKSNCGWPSFDDAYQQNVKFKPDPDKHRTEIICANCNGHLGHLFLGEGYTEKNRRFCVNSTTIEFVKSSSVENTEEIILAGGCFWGIEASFQKQPGVLKTEVGYTGGKTTVPTYETVSTGETGHLEAVRIVYDPSVATLKDLYQLFFEIHDFEHEKSEAVNVGNQYLSCIFYYNQTQKEIANAVVSQLKSNNYQVATILKPIRTFWSAESYHQSYYQKNFRQSWCQTKKIFLEVNLNY